MEAVTTLLAGLTILLAALLIPLRAKASATGEQDMSALKALVDERSRSVEERSAIVEENSGRLNDLSLRLDALDERDSERERVDSEALEDAIHLTAYFSAPQTVAGWNAAVSSSFADSYAAALKSIDPAIKNTLEANWSGIAPQHSVDGFTQLYESGHALGWGHFFHMPSTRIEGIWKENAELARPMAASEWPRLAAPDAKTSVKRYGDRKFSSPQGPVPQAS